MSQLKDMYKAFVKSEDKFRFIFYDGWALYGETLRESRIVVFFFTILSLVKSFVEEKLTRKAADLTYSTIMSIVPILAIIFAVAKGFGMEDMMWTQIENLIGAGDIMDQVLMSVSKSVEMAKANSGWIFGVAFLALVYTANNAMCKLEDIFNEIWNVESKNGWFKRLPYNMFFLLLLPVMILMVGAITGRVEGFIGAYVTFADWVIRSVIVSSVFIMAYKILPDTDVKWRGAIVSGIIAGIAMTIWHFIYLEFQNILFNYNKVYGSFAAIPFFLIWTLISWLILLIGAKFNNVLQMSFILKRWTLYDQENLQQMSMKDKLLIVVTVSSAIVKCFINARRITIHSLVEDTKITDLYVAYALGILQKSEIIHISGHDKNEDVYFPSIPLENITVGQLLRRIYVSGVSDVVDSDSVVNVYVSNILGSLENEADKLLRNL